MPKMGLKKPPTVDFRTSSEDWLIPIQNALINTQGIFFITGMPPSTYYDAGIEAGNWSSWTAYSKLARRIAKTYMLATQHHPYALHCAVDIYNGPQKSSTNLTYCAAPTIGEHIDRGVFNIVYGRREDFRGLQLFFKGEYWDVEKYFAEGGYDRVKGVDGFVCLVIPGFGLEAFDNCFKAVTHRVMNGSYDKKSVNFHCRFRPDFVLPSGETFEQAAAKVFSPAGAKQEPGQFLVADIQSPCGSYRAILHADPAMTAEELKSVFVQHTQWDVKPQDLGLICHSGVGLFFEGSSLKDLAQVMDYPQALRFTAHPKHKT